MTTGVAPGRATLAAAVGAGAEGGVEVGRTGAAALPSVLALAAVCALLAAGAWLTARSVAAASRGKAGTVATASGERTRTAGYALGGLALVGALWASVGGLLPPSVPVVVAAFLAAVGVAGRVDPDRTADALEYGAVVAVAGLVVAFALAPLSGVPLPDIGVLGPYTYLATEVAFGAVALGLLARAGRDALRAAARTVAVVYPVAYVWDWYTLTVGVFAVPLRTGVEFAGIPVEEHLFMVVVPAFVLGVHETLRSRDRE